MTGLFVITPPFAHVTFRRLSVGRNRETLQWKMSATKTACAPCPPGSEESRRWERHQTSIPVEVTAFLNGGRASYRGDASDISCGGMRLFVPRELEPGTSLILEFLIPYQAVKFTLNGVIRNRAGFSHGVEFINATPQHEEMIERTCKVFELLR